MKRLVDVFFSFIGLLLFAPFLLIICFFIWKFDGGSPFYIANRAGRFGVPFSMIKLRSMSVNADSTGVDSTSEADPRITPVGKIVRRYKLDEIMQLVNVFFGEMSLVGPRPNVLQEVNLYTEIEKDLLLVKPGITDIASIVFSDEGKILRDYPDPDIAYHQLIRPGKSELGLYYASRSNIFLDFALIILTIVSIFSRETSLKLLVFLMRKMNAPNRLVSLSSRKFELIPSPPPGAKSIVTSRD